MDIIRQTIINSIEVKFNKSECEKLIKAQAKLRSYIESTGMIDLVICDEILSELVGLPHYDAKSYNKANNKHHMAGCFD